MLQFLALTSPGIEILLAEELNKLGATDITQKPEGVYFSAELDKAYHICLWSRLASRVLLKIEQFDCESVQSLQSAAASVEWSAWFNSDSLFAIDFVGKNQDIRNSQFGALTVKDGIVDHFRNIGEARPSVDKVNPDIRIQARLLRKAVTFYLDFSGRALFQRGYRQHSGAAPLKENLAAALVMRSAWLEDTTKPLVDPMCGSGTILIEAVSMAAGIAPGIEREKWGFEGWLGHDEAAYQEALVSAIDKSNEGLANTNVKVFGVDIDSRVIKTAQQNARNAGIQSFIEFKCSDTNKMNNQFGEPGTILFNPPYGERIGELPELVESFVILGQKLKQQFNDWRVAIFTANIELLSMLKLASFKRYKFKNGPLDCQFALYNIDEKQSHKDALSPETHFDETQSAFANRLKKNVKNLKSWVKKENIECYRLYDADIPEYNVAVDLYGEYVVIQEYAAPNTIEQDKAAKRLQEVIYFVPRVLGVATNKVVLKTRAKQKGTNQYQKVDRSQRELIVHEYGAKLKVNLWDYLDTGLFLDHRKTRQIVASKSKGKTVLNLFAYTGSVSLHAALHGAASVTTVDMSKTYLSWAEDNFSLNNLSGHKYQFIQADCLQWLKQNKEKFDVVFIDPPTFSNSKRMEENSFDVQRDHVGLITDGLASLKDSGELIFTNNKRNFKMDFEAMTALSVTVKSMSDLTRDKDFQRNKHIHNSWLITKND